MNKVYNGKDSNGYNDVSEIVNRLRRNSTGCRKGFRAYNAPIAKR